MIKTPAPPRTVYWLSKVPTHCEVTKAPIEGAFIDGKTQWGPWALMTPEAHAKHGCSLGQGRGQRYEPTPGGKRWVKVEG